MSEYYNNYSQNPYMGNQNMGSENNGLHTPEPSAPKRRKSSGRAARTAKKIGAITLSAVLFGGVAAGTFQGVNYLTGYTAEQTAQAEESAQSASVGSGSAGSPAQNGSASAGSQTLQTATASDSGEMSVADVADYVMPSIVSITNRSVQEVQNYFSMFGYYGMQPQAQETESVGSGIIIGQNDSELLIATNNHVVEGADTLTVSFIDNQAYEANLKGTDAENDLAVIAVPLTGISADTMAQIKPATLGSSDDLRVGEQVVAIGNALGYGQSVTTGIVSATNRTLTETSSDGRPVQSSASYIQTDAAINPGNSGGALVNMKGEVVGINSAKLASTEVEGMGYAIPVSRASSIISTLMNESTLTKVAENERGTLGITATTVPASVTEAYGIPTGVYVSEVTEGSGAQAAGLRRGDVITALDGRSVTDVSQLQELLQYYKAGQTVNLTVQSITDSAYAEKTVSLTLSGQADSDASAKA
ncbi:MAG TPA: trypsin-like peptidase domain-containing protein [Candidatus Eisenbergiella pullistercoris]|uniref:Trypsin-like peptidase domain-containing protein n=1 Tax=Candidatus Eisenbergiella pullistercoris TaxID=2838555 RepID=A0A9D1YRM4_9FIRM|nr:trypsin-like peptidase domain-containing protein [Candidatus Eisenbergiella pullistercoris]